MKKQLAVCSVFFILLVGTTLSSAAVFQFYGGGLHSQSDSYAENTGTGAINDGPVGVQGGHPDVTSDSWSELDMPYISSYGGGYGFSDVVESFVVIVEVGGWADGYSETPDGIMDSYGNGNTVAPGHTTGIFYQIMPEFGEVMGQTVNVHFYWSAYADAYHDGAKAVLNGGYDGPDMNITVNEFPSPEPSVNRVWEHGPIEVINDYFEDEENGFFTAQIGDIIGIHLGALAEFYWEGEAYEAYADASNMMALELETPIPVPGAFLLFGTGLLGLMGIRRRKQD